MVGEERESTSPDLAPVHLSPTPAALCENGFGLRSAGRPLEAAQCCRQALSIDANHADAMHLMGLLSFDAGQYDHAVEWIARAIRQNPKVEYLTNLGAALQRQKRYDEALKPSTRRFNSNRIAPGCGAISATYSCSSIATMRRS